MAPATDTETGDVSINARQETPHDAESERDGETNTPIEFRPQIIEEMIRESPNLNDWTELYSRIEVINDMASLGLGLPLDAELSPTVQRDIANEAISAYSHAMGLWTFFGVDDVNVTWTLMSEDDYDWWVERVRTIEGDHPALDVWVEGPNLLGHCYLNAYSFCGYGNTQSVLGTSFQYNVIGSKYRGSGSLGRSNTVLHESVHFYQASLSEDLRSVTPCWFEEGQATLIGNAASGYPGGFSYGAKNELNRFGQKLRGDSTWTVSEWKELFDSYVADGQARDECLQSGVGYTTGAAAFEYLYMNFSMWQIHEVTLRALETGSWELAVPEVLGITSEELNSRLSGYMVEILAEK